MSQDSMWWRVLKFFWFLGEALFSSENFLVFKTIALSFLFDKYCPIMKSLGLKDSSHDLQENCVISFIFCLYLVLHACVARFDVMRNLEFFFWFLEWTKGNKVKKL